MAAAQVVGDISTIIKIIARTSGLTVEDFIKKTCGSLLFMYYAYLKKFQVRPVDMDDMIDGLLFLDAEHYVQKQQMMIDKEK